VVTLRLPTRTFLQTGDGFRAKLSTKRHSEGRNSIFKLEPVHIELMGRSNGLNAVCTGTAVEVPGLIFKAVLRFIAE
jgi:hypothetical protein